MQTVAIFYGCNTMETMCKTLYRIRAKWELACDGNSDRGFNIKKKKSTGRGAKQRVFCLTFVFEFKS